MIELSTKLERKAQPPAKYASQPPLNLLQHYSLEFQGGKARRKNVAENVLRFHCDSGVNLLSRFPLIVCSPARLESGRLGDHQIGASTYFFAVSLTSGMASK
jgi:hypothetical protein